MSHQPEPTLVEDEPKVQSNRAAKRVCIAVLAGWNLFMLLAVLVELSFRHRPHIQTGASNIVMGILIDSWFVVNLVIITAALLTRRWGRKRANGRTVEPSRGIGTPSTVA
jgi:hypothetical protein